MLNKITGYLTLFLGAVAGPFLIVGGTGIMNIMVVNVPERTRDRRPHCRRGEAADILVQLLIESITLSFVGVDGCSPLGCGCSFLGNLYPGLYPW